MCNQADHYSPQKTNPLGKYLFTYDVMLVAEIFVQSGHVIVNELHCNFPEGILYLTLIRSHSSASSQFIINYSKQN